MEDRKPLCQAIYRDTVAEYRAFEGQTYEEIRNGIESEYRRRVSSYVGEKHPAYEGEGVDPEALKRRAAFKKQKQSQGRL